MKQELFVTIKIKSEIRGPIVVPWWAHMIPTFLLMGIDYQYGFQLGHKGILTMVEYLTIHQIGNGKMELMKFLHAKNSNLHEHKGAIKKNRYHYQTNKDTKAREKLNKV